MHALCILHAFYLHTVYILSPLPFSGHSDNFCQRRCKTVTTSPPLPGLPCLRFPRNAGSHSGNALYFVMPMIKIIELPGRSPLAGRLEGRCRRQAA